MKEEKEQPQGGVAQLLNAETAAEEIVQQAKAEAEQILIQARKRAEDIRRSHGEAGSEAEMARIREEAEREKRLLLEEAKRKVEEVRKKAEAREEEAVQYLLTLLFGELFGKPFGKLCIGRPAQSLSDFVYAPGFQETFKGPLPFLYAREEKRERPLSVPLRQGAPLTSGEIKPVGKKERSRLLRGKVERCSEALTPKNVGHIGQCAKETLHNPMLLA